MTMKLEMSFGVSFIAVLFKWKSKEVIIIFTVSQHSSGKPKICLAVSKLRKKENGMVFAVSFFGDSLWLLCSIFLAFSVSLIFFGFSHVFEAAMEIFFAVSIISPVTWGGG